MFAFFMAVAGLILLLPSTCLVIFAIDAMAAGEIIAIGPAIVFLAISALGGLLIVEACRWVSSRDGGAGNPDVRRASR